MKKTIGIRVDEKKEIDGQDTNEPSMRTYLPYESKD
jgi:hypothetical protein